jgi:osmotically-inducible protein OsmY
MAMAVPLFLLTTNVFADSRSSNDRLIQEVRHELSMLPYYGVFDDLTYTVSGTSIELRGAVTRPSLKSDAENVVKNIEGVTQVKNGIEVLPLSAVDDRIRVASFRAIYGDSALSTRYGYRAQPPIHIIVRDGHVTLEGIVANEFDRNLINIQQNGVAGVYSVTNNLRLDPSSKS